MEHIITAKNLDVSLDKKIILNQLCASVPMGSVYGLLGPNGAGKTTFIRTLVNIYQPAAGTLTVLGKKSTEIQGSMFEQIGYVSENQEFPDWMAVEQFLNYCGRFYNAWDYRWVEDKIRRYNLPRLQPLKSLSRGN